MKIELEKLKKAKQQDFEAIINCIVMLEKAGFKLDCQEQKMLEKITDMCNNADVDYQEKKYSTIDVVISIKNKRIVRAKAFYNNTDASNYRVWLMGRYKDEETYLRFDVPLRSKEPRMMYDKAMLDADQIDFERNPEAVYAGMDKLIVTSVRKLNALGVKTYASCQGHDMKHHPAWLLYASEPWIDEMLKNMGFTLKNRGKTRNGTKIKDATKFDRAYKRLWAKVEKELLKTNLTESKKNSVKE